MLFFIFYFPLPSRASRAGGRIQAESMFYIYAEVQHISSIHYSLWAAFPCSFVMCFLHRGCSRRTATYFSFRSSPRPMYNNMCIFAPRKPSAYRLSNYDRIYSRFVRDRRKFIEQFYGRNTTALWKRFHLALETTSSSSS